jgi:hypothetical protein
MKKVFFLLVVLFLVTASAFGHTPANPTIFTFNPATSTLAPY